MVPTQDWSRLLSDASSPVVDEETHEEHAQSSLEAGYTREGPVDSRDDDGGPPGQKSKIQPV